jgi:hypothetical protein
MYSMDNDHAYYFSSAPTFHCWVSLCFCGLYCVDLVYVTVPYDADLLSASIPKAKKFFEVIMPEVLGGYFYLKSNMRTEVPPNSIVNQYLRCYCQKNYLKVKKPVFCADENCKRKRFHESSIKSQLNAPKRITKLWKCDTCRKIYRTAAAKKRIHTLLLIPIWCREIFFQMFQIFYNYKM